MIFTDADLSFSPCLVGFASGVKVLFARAFSMDLKSDQVRKVHEGGGSSQ